MDRLAALVGEFLQLPKSERTRPRRERLLAELGVHHPGRFLDAVWAPHWDEAIDRLLDPAQTLIRPLDVSDFHFKWGLGAFNALPSAVRARIFAMKLEANALRPVVEALFATAGQHVAGFEVMAMTAVPKVHSEAVVTIRTPDGQARIFEVSHFSPVAEEIYCPAARLFDLATAAVRVESLPRGGKVLLSLPVSGVNLGQGEIPVERLRAEARTIVRGVARHDAMGDVMGTILRDPHQILTPEGTIATIHHYELFHEVEGFHFGFQEPIFGAVGRRLHPGEVDLGPDPVAGLFAEYRAAYAAEAAAIRDGWPTLERHLEASRALIGEYLGEGHDIQAAIDGVKARAFRDPEAWLKAVWEETA